MRLMQVLSVAALAAVSLTVEVRAGGDKIAFPGELRHRRALYDGRSGRQQAVPRALRQPAGGDRRGQEGRAAAERDRADAGALRRKLDAQGNPEKDANGRFIKGDLVAYTVMEKRTGWGTEYPDNIRNGEWEYQAFTADKKVNDKANLTNCYTCHKPLDKQDFVFSYDKLKTHEIGRPTQTPGPVPGLKNVARLGRGDLQQPGRGARQLRFRRSSE